MWCLVYLYEVKHKTWNIIEGHHNAQVALKQNKFDTPALSIARPLIVLFALDLSGWADIPVKGKQNEEQRASQVNLHLMIISLFDAAFILSL